MERNTLHLNATTRTEWITFYFCVHSQLDGPLYNISLSNDLKLTGDDGTVFKPLMSEDSYDHIMSNDEV